MNTTNNKKNLPAEQAEELLKVLKARFEKNMQRHQDIDWPGVQEKHEAKAEKLWSLNEK